MGLNDDVMEDIDTTTDPSFINDDTMKTVSENINTIIKDSGDVTDNAMLNRIVSADIAIKTLDEEYTSICEKRAIEEEVISKESISRIDAELIQHIFSGLLTPTVTLEQFTTVNSKTNYAFAIRYMVSRISLEQENMNINYSLFLNKSLSDVSSVLEEIQNKYIVTLKDSLTYLKFTNNDLHGKLLNNKNLVVPYEDRFENISKISISNLNIDSIKLNIPDRNNLKKNILNIKTLLEDKDINSLIKCVDKKDDLNCIYKTIYGLELTNVDGLSLAQCIESSILDSHIDLLSNHITELLKRIEVLIQNNTKNIDDFEKISSDFEDMKLESIEIISKSSTITNLIIKLISLLNGLETLFEFYKRF